MSKYQNVKKKNVKLACVASVVALDGPGACAVSMSSVVALVGPGVDKPWVASVVVPVGRGG